MRRIALAPLVGLLLVALVAPTVSAQPVRNQLLTDIPVTGTLNAVPFAGEIDITSITRDGDDLVVAGQLFNATGSLVGNFTATVEDLLSGPASGPGQRTGQCKILTLDLGPLDLDVLGLVVELSDIQLDITAVRGPGNLLGNLLCAVAGLLDGGPLAKLDRILDRINRIL